MTLTPAEIQRIRDAAFWTEYRRLASSENRMSRRLMEIKAKECADEAERRAREGETR